MKTKNNTQDKQFRAIIGVDLGDSKHAICVTDKSGNIHKEYSIGNTRKQIEKLASTYPNALIALEVGTHSPWVSRLLSSLGATVIVANARKLRAIYNNPRKSDLLDARMLAKLVRVDPELLHPVHHAEEDTQIDFLPIKMRETLVRQRVNIINAIRGALKALGIRIPNTTSRGFDKQARLYLEKHHSEMLPSISPMLDILVHLKAQITAYDQAIDTLIADKNIHQHSSFSKSEVLAL